MTKMSPEKESKSNALPKVLVNDEEEGVANAAGKHGILPASARFVVPASTAAASKLVLFDVMDTIVADPFFRGFHKVTARTPSPAGSFRVRLRYGTARALCTPCALCCCRTSSTSARSRSSSRSNARSPSSPSRKAS